MSTRSATAFPWLYEGVWGVLVQWFRVPEKPPTLPADAGEVLQTFRPAPGSLQYRRIMFIIGLLVSIPFMLGLLGFVVTMSIATGVLWGFLLIPVLIALIAAATLMNYVGLYLHYDTTWYVVGPRSLCVREGVWVVRETIVAYENVQNVSISQGPLQRVFGISDVRVETAGAAMSGGKDKVTQASGTVLAGLGNPEEVKALIQTRLDGSRVQGLGDEEDPAIASPGRGWSEAHVALLKEIRDAARAL
jgi:membrane protein YdbS with pleckstrin-like domain